MRIYAKHDTRGELQFNVLHCMACTGFELDAIRYVSIRGGCIVLDLSLLLYAQLKSRAVVLRFAHKM